MEDGVWRTIGGRRVFIKEGQSLSDAMKESGKFGNKNEKARKSVMLKQQREKLKKRLYDKNSELSEEEQKKLKEEIKDLTKQKQELDKDLTEEDLKNARHELEDEKYKSKHNENFDIENGEAEALIKENNADLQTELENELFNVDKYEEDVGIDDNIVSEILISTKTMQKLKEMHENGEISDYAYERIIDETNRISSNIMVDKGYELFFYKGKYYYSMIPKAKKAYDEILTQLDKNRYEYEISKSWNAGELPSIYVKNENGNTFRIANHFNSKNQQFKAFSLEKNKIYSTNEYIDYKNTIMKDLKNFFK